MGTGEQEASELMSEFFFCRGRSHNNVTEKRSRSIAWAPIWEYHITRARLDIYILANMRKLSRPCLAYILLPDLLTNYWAIQYKKLCIR